MINLKEKISLAMAFMMVFIFAAGAVPTSVFASSNMNELHLEAEGLLEADYPEDREEAVSMHDRLIFLASALGEDDGDFEDTINKINVKALEGAVSFLEKEELAEQIMRTYLIGIGSEAEELDSQKEVLTDLVELVEQGVSDGDYESVDALRVTDRLSEKITKIDLVIGELAEEVPAEEEEEVPAEEEEEVPVVEEEEEEEEVPVEEEEEEEEVPVVEEEKEEEKEETPVVEEEEDKKVEIPLTPLVPSTPIEKEIDIDEIKKEIKVVLEEAKLVLKFPEVKDHSFNYVISVEGTEVAKGNEEKEAVLPVVSKETKFDIEIEVINVSKEVVGEIALSHTFKDTEKPVIKYAYVEDGYLFVVYEDNYALAEEPFGYSFDKGKRFRYTSRDSIAVEIPERITIEITDSFGNKTTQDVEIKEDNKVVFGKAPKEIEDRLFSGEVTQYKHFENVIVIEKDKTINVIDLFEELFEDVFEKDFDERELYFESDDIVLDRYNEFKSSKPGVLSLNITHRHLKGEINLFFYVKESKKQSDIRSIKGEEKRIITSTEEVALDDVIIIEWLRNTKDEDKEDISNLFYKEYRQNDALPISEKIVLRKNSINKVEIIDVLNGKIYLIEIEHDKDGKEIIAKVAEKDKAEGIVSSDKIKINSPNGQPATGFVKYFTDIDSNHWAAESITKVTSIGIAHGYPDRSFGAMNNMSVREFLTMYGRFLAMVPEEAKTEASNHSNIFVSGNQWGITESNSVLNRLSADKLALFNADDIGRSIKREEVAFIIANTIKMADGGDKNAFEDIASSPYKQEINALTRDGRINGYPNGTFQPANFISRAEIAQLIANLF